MAKKKDKKQLKRIIICFSIILVILMIILIILISNNSKKKEIPEAQVQAEYKESKENSVLEKLYKMTEQERMNYYCAEFIKLIDNKEYEKAYDLLYEEYKENYFPTFASFKKYAQDYFPDDIALTYKNIERLGSIYVMWVRINDTLNGSKYGHNFDMYIVIQENDYDDYVISFSRNSAVDYEGEEE